MKNFNIFGGLLKNLTFKVGLHENLIYRGVLPKKGGFDSLQVEGGAWQE